MPGRCAVVESESLGPDRPCDKRFLLQPAAYRERLHPKKSNRRLVIVGPVERDFRDHVEGPCVAVRFDAGTVRDKPCATNHFRRRDPDQRRIFQWHRSRTLGGPCRDIFGRARVARESSDRETGSRDRDGFVLEIPERLRYNAAKRKRAASGGQEKITDVIQAEISGSQSGTDGKRLGHKEAVSRRCRDRACCRVGSENCAADAARWPAP